MSATTEVAVGMSSCGIAAGARVVFDALSKDVAERGLPVTVVTTGCIGACHAEPLVEVRQPDGRTFLYGNIDETKAHSIVESHLVGGAPVADLVIPVDYPYLAKQKRIVLSNCGVIDPESIEQYIARDGYVALKKVLTTMTPQQVIDDVKLSGLRGRGGAGFSTGMKWSFAAGAKTTTGKKYVICNADEGDPGAFMDRSVLEGDPHAVLEGMMIGAYAMGADEGYIYVRAEYPLAIKRLEIALRQMARARAHGQLHHGHPVHLPPAHQGRRGGLCLRRRDRAHGLHRGQAGMPRLRPPSPPNAGCGAPDEHQQRRDLRECAPIIPWAAPNTFAGIGTEKSKGTKVFALAGKINGAA